MNNIKLKNENDCEYCGRCMLVCPTNAILFKSRKWNYYPHIDSIKCIKCHRCEIVCNQQLNFINKEPSFFVGISKKYSQDLKSSSGGIFPEIAEYVIKNNGFVYGAVFDEKRLIIKHLRINNLLDLNKLRKSKYVQSDWGTIICTLKEDIKSGKQVLFSGTPCQVSAVYDFWGSYENLILLDLFCHGVSCSKPFHDYLFSMKKKINNVDFRSYDTNNYNYNFNFNFNDGSPDYTVSCDKDPFYSSFISSESLKLSCFNCRYAVNFHKSDITIGDFDDIDYAYRNGINFHHPSIIAVNSSKGQNLLNSLATKFIYKKIQNNDLTKLYYKSHNITGAWGYNINERNAFFSRFKTKGISAFYIKIQKIPPLKKMLLQIRKILKFIYNILRGPYER